MNVAIKTLKQKIMVHHMMGNMMIFLPGLIMLLSLHCNAAQTFSYRYTIQVGTCTVTSPTPTVNFNNNNAIDPNTYIDQNWKYSYQAIVPVSLSNCSGYSAGLTPYLYVAGITASGSMDSTERKNSVFVGGSNTTGFGVVIGKTLNTPLVDGDTSGLVSTQGTYIQLAAAGTEITGTQSYNVNAALTCGSAADCAASRLHSGTITVPVYFEFYYK